MTKVDGATQFTYDANGNMITRIAGSDTYTLTFDTENRLITVTKNTMPIATFTYDADVARVKGVVNGVTTYYVNQNYEKTISGANTIQRRYYTAGPGGQRIAVRVEGDVANNGLFYLLSDTLSSTTFSVDGSSGAVSEVRYSAWGGDPVHVRDGADDATVHWSVSGEGPGRSGWVVLL